MILAGIVTAILIGYVGPVNGYLGQRAELRAERAQLAQLEARRGSLTAQLAALERDDVLATRARGLGMVLPGERAFFIRSRDLQPPPPARPAGDDGIWGWLTHLL